MQSPIGLILATALIVTTSGCSNSRPEAADSGSTDKDKSRPTRDKSDKGDGGSDDGVGGDGDGQSDGGGGNDNNGSDGSIEQDPNTVAGCGNSSFTQDIESANVPYKGQAGKIFTTDYTVVVKGGLNFSSQAQSLSTRSSFNLISADPPNAADRARKELAKVTGSREATLASNAQAPCGTLLASRIVETTGDHTSTIDFSPPIPYLLTPKLSTERFQSEYANGRTFSDLKLTVASTTNENLTAGSEANGSVTITSVNPKTTFNDTSGRSVTVDADYGFRLEFNFGSHEEVNNFGLYKVATYYVKAGSFQVITVETGVDEAPAINYLVNQ